ncbi:MAG TPA: class I SAM-dependent methyltransferase [Baekduia sp.]|nr:class I SAM-dependent methyltransferase [Baekduia sp.]
MTDEPSTDRLAAEALAKGDPTGWFEPLYAASERAGTAPPWDRDTPRPLLRQWAEERDIRGDGLRAVVVGAGLGADAEYVASLGFDTLAFDISATAVRLARERSAHANVTFAVGDLLQLPDAWRGAFDLVVESYTVQALPLAVRADAIAGVVALLAPGGTLLVIAAARRDGTDIKDGDGPPWPLDRAEIASFAAATDPPLRTVALDLMPDAFWRAEYARGRDR